MIETMYKVRGQRGVKIKPKLLCRDYHFVIMQGKIHLQRTQEKEFGCGRVRVWSL